MEKWRLWLEKWWRQAPVCRTWMNWEIVRPLTSRVSEALKKKRLKKKKKKNWTPKVFPAKAGLNKFQVSGQTVNAVELESKSLPSTLGVLVFQQSAQQHRQKLQGVNACSHVCRQGHGMELSAMQALDHPLWGCVPKSRPCVLSQLLGHV